MLPRRAFTLIEMLVVIGIILALAALAAAFLPRVNDSQKLTRAVDSFEQWLLTAKMRAKRDGLVTGIRFMQAPGDLPGEVSQFQYVQQPEPLSGGQHFVPWTPGPNRPPFPPNPYQFPAGSGNWYSGGLLVSASSTGVLTFAGNGVDFWLGHPIAPPNPLVQTGDRLEINDGGVYEIAAASSSVTLLLKNSPHSSTLNFSAPTTNYRILRQPRILIGEEPLVLPQNYAAHFRPIPGSSSSLSGTNVPQNTNGFWEILFAPNGAVTGIGTASGFVYVSLWDSTMDTPDINRVGLVGVRMSTGFIGAYSASPGTDPFYFVKTARESGL